MTQPMEICTECGGWRQDITTFHNTKRYYYWKCITCGGIWDGQGNKIPREARGDHRGCTGQVGEHSEDTGEDKPNNEGD